jgi:hypothetical protein
MDIEAEITRRIGKVMARRKIAGALKQLGVGDRRELLLDMLAEQLSVPVREPVERPSRRLLSALRDGPKSIAELSALVYSSADKSARARTRVMICGLKTRGLVRRVSFGRWESIEARSNVIPLHACAATG